MATTRTNGEQGRGRVANPAAGTVAVARDLAEGIAGAAGTVAGALPEAAATTRAAIDDAAKRLDDGSDEILAVGATYALGLATGLLVGGAPRVLVLAALVPVGAVGMTLVNRSRSATRGRATS
ncbi:MAG TPA: hypothetical protein VH813_10855 [Candidatus Limnocylindrales bacterium]|jgi:hypothetical protein